jgi:hypothetical protein
MAIICREVDDSAYVCEANYENLYRLSGSDIDVKIGVEMFVKILSPLVTPRFLPQFI